jgi:hypothetical protein
LLVVAAVGMTKVAVAGLVVTEHLLALVVVAALPNQNLA